MGKLSRLEAEQCLEGLRNGTYLVRRTLGKTPEYTHAIAVRYVLVVEISVVMVETISPYISLITLGVSLVSPHFNVLFVLK